LVGTNTKKIISKCRELLSVKIMQNKNVNIINNLYGDGKSTEQILSIINEQLINKN